MNEDIEIIAKKYKLDPKAEKNPKKFFISPLKTITEERLTHSAFDIISPPTLLHKRYEDKIKALEIENSRLINKVVELKESNKKLSQELEMLKSPENQSVVYKSVSEDLEDKSKIIEELEELVRFYKEELEFSLSSAENEDSIKTAEINYLKTQVDYYKNLPDAESVALIRESNQKLMRNVEVLKINCVVQEEIIEKLKKQLSLVDTRESQEVISLQQQLKETRRMLESEKSHKKSLTEYNATLNASLKALKFELELEKAKSPKFLYSSILSTNNSP